ncbi:MAG: hypothetical protein JSV05_02135 [Candidatus Bathyarchaeota archaeon]|nr:MAG: hypothetical protein JSV05_02135 [Candidatus Bathyarchaeota archaeon]
MSEFDIFSIQECDIYSRKYFYLSALMVKMHSLVKRTIELKNELVQINTREKALNQRIRRIEAQLGTKELDNKAAIMHEATTKAHLTLWFNSEGKAPTSVIMRLQNIGFKLSREKCDFTYEWEQEINLEEMTRLGDTVHKILKGTKVLYKLETF